MKTLFSGFILVVGLLTAPTAPAADYDPYIERLREAGIEPTAPSLAKYFQSLVPAAENAKQAAELVEQLGAAKFKQREQAQQAILALPQPPVAILTEAAAADDPEIRFRARRILQQLQQDTSHNLPRTAMGYVAHHQMKGLAEPLLELLPHWTDESQSGVARRALAATARPEDAELLRKATRHEAAHVRAAAATALNTALLSEAAGDMAALLEDKDHHVQLVAAEALANLGKRQSLAALVQLLQSHDVTVRSRAVALLRSLTRQQFEFVPYDKPLARLDSVERWRGWLETDGRTAKLHFPLKPIEQYIGRTLISMWPGTLREVNAKHDKMFEKTGFKYAWGCHALPSGERLLVDYTQKFVVQFDAQGNEVWRRDNLPGSPSDCRRLPGGSTLLVLTDGILMEIDPEGEVVWRVEIKGRPTTAQRLENGNTLVNLQFAKKVVEIDRSGEVVWELGGLNNVLTAQALPEGNVLVCEMSEGKAVEYDRSGHKVWEKGGFTNACQAQRLPDGNTLVSDNNGLHEINPEGKEVWSMKVPRGRFWRY